MASFHADERVAQARAGYVLGETPAIRPSPEQTDQLVTAIGEAFLAIPIIGTKDFMGTGRYVLVAFPVMAAAGEYLATTERRWVRPVALTLCGVLLVVLTALYGRGVAVS